jgi:hypothetical protein
MGILGQLVISSHAKDHGGQAGQGKGVRVCGEVFLVDGIWIDAMGREVPCPPCPLRQSSSECGVCTHAVGPEVPNSSCAHLLSVHGPVPPAVLRRLGLPEQSLPATWLPEQSLVCCFLLMPACLVWGTWRALRPAPPPLPSGKLLGLASCNACESTLRLPLHTACESTLVFQAACQGCLRDLEESLPKSD